MDLEKKAKGSLEGEKTGHMVIERFLDLRYEGQSYELTVPYGNDFKEDFHRLHRKRYHHCYKERAIEAVNVRVKVKVLTPKPEFFLQKPEKKDPGKAFLKEKEVFWGRFVKTPLYKRELLEPGMKIDGPAIVFSTTSTISIPPGFGGYVDKFENIILEEKDFLC